MSTKILIGDLLRKPNGTLGQKDIRLIDFMIEPLAQTFSQDIPIDLLNFTDGVVAILPMLDIPVKLECHSCGKTYSANLETDTTETTFYLNPDDCPEVENPELIERKHMEIDLMQTLTDAIETAIPLNNYCENCEDKEHSYQDTPLSNNPFKDLQ